MPYFQLYYCTQTDAHLWYFSVCRVLQVYSQAQSRDERLSFIRPKHVERYPVYLPHAVDKPPLQQTSLLEATELSNPVVVAVR